MNWMRRLAYAAAGLGGALLLISLTPGSAWADTTITNCTDADLGAAISAGGVITFNCGGVNAPTTISITTSSRQVVAPLTINGGGVITLNGSTASGIFWVRSPSGVLTLTNIALTGATGNAILNDASLTLSRTTMTSNATAVFNRTGSMRVTDSVFEGNPSAILSDALLDIRRSSFVSNGSPALFVRSSSALVENSTFISNTSAALTDAPLTLRNVTLAGNSGALNARLATTTMSNTVFANAGANCLGSLVSAGNNLSTDGTCNLNQPTDLPNTPALLGAPAGGHVAPLPGSLAIDSGVCAQTQDALLQTRPGAGTPYCDIGAVEAQGVTVDLATSASVFPAQAMLGRAVTYTVVVSNNGTGRAPAFVLTDTLAAEFVGVVSQTQVTAGALISWTGAGGVSTWAGANLRQGARITVTLTGSGAVTLTQSTLLTSTAVVRAALDGAASNDSSAASFLAAFAPNLSLTKSGPPAPVLPGERVTFTIGYSNTGFAAASGWITDAVPVTLTQPVAAWSGPLTASPGVTFSWQFTALPPHTGGLITVSGVAAQNVLGNAIFTNTVTGSAGGDLVVEDDSASASLNLSTCFARAFDGATDGPVRFIVQQAVDDATSGQTVKVAGYCTGQLSVAKSLTIRGGYAITEWVTPNAALYPTRLDGLQTGRVVAVQAGPVTLDWLALINGRVSGDDGAGLRVAASVAVTLSRAVISGNIAAQFNADGGGIANYGTLVITASQVTANATSNSSSGRGGGIANFSSLSIAGSSIVSNTNNNSSNTGGGLYSSGALTITNATFAGNRADGFNHQGGALYLDTGTAALTNVTIAGNGVSGTSSTGGGIARNSATVTLSNTLLVDNTGSNCAGTLGSGGYNLSSDASCAFAATGDRNATPVALGALRNNGGPIAALGSAALTRAPMPGTLAIDFGRCDLPVDQLGLARPGAGPAACDIGAVEAQFISRSVRLPILRL